MIRSVIGILCLVILITASGCRSAVSQITSEPDLAIALKSESLTIPTDTSITLFSDLKQPSSVARYYQVFGADPIWIEGGKYSSRGDSMLFIIKRASYYGLSSERYHVTELETLAANDTPAGHRRKEVLLTDAFLLLAGDLKFGLQQLKQKEKEDSIRISLLNKAVTSGVLLGSLESQEPAIIAYESLKEGLAEILDSLKHSNTDPVSLSEKIRLISVNMERWRRETATFGSRYIFINIPSFMLDVVDGDSTVLVSRVIVGTPEKQTPELSSVVECFTIYPYWHVPRKISIEEYLPILKKDTSFLRKNNFDVLDRRGNVLNPDSLNWNKFNENYFPVSLRQREGIENSLGVIKFIFDNPYAVFLHDTNAKRLFRSPSRAFSHGCIRMEKAVDLAHYLVTGTLNTESKTVSRYLKEKQQRWIDLKNPIPIYTRYFTCEFRNSTLYVYKDIYGKDQPIYDLLYGSVQGLDL